jgi:hypothetical protein
MNGLAKQNQPTTEGLERVLIEGNLSALSPDQRIQYYQRVCESVGLNPLTQPFEYLTLQGKMILYARRACTDQLRQIHRISVTVTSREKMDGIYVVTARATAPDGRTDESIGAVPVEGLKGENYANALMKAETKAKRRVTLALCGLSLLDELEVESVQSASRAAAGKPRRTLDDVAAPATPATDRSLPAAAQQPSPAFEFDGATGEVIYTTEMHAAALSDCGPDGLQAWFDTLQTFELTEEQKRTAWQMFRARCAVLKADPADYVSK